MDNLTVNMTRDYVELLEIIRILPREEAALIPKSELDFYERHKDLTYSFKIDPSIELSKQNISRGAYALFLILYQKYIATPEEKYQITNRLILNEKKTTKIINEQQISEELPKEEAMILHKNEESFFTRIISKIKRFFGK